MNNLKAMRELRGLTQKELADASGVNIRILQYYEQGRKNINHGRAEAIVKIANALQCAVTDILN